MRYFNLVIVVAAAVLGLSGLAFGEESSYPTTPASAQNEKEPTLLDKVAKFEKGKTTVADVVKELGEPGRITTMPDSTKHLQYGKSSYFGKGYSAVLIFDEKDVLKEKMTAQY